MYEIIVNLHMHTRYSDGHASHDEIARSAIRTGLDAVIVTDHNVWVNGPEDYYREGEKKVLLLVGEEIHDQARHPQKNHLLVFGAGQELAPLAWNTQRLLDAVRRAGGLAFLAHPFDPASPAVDETDITWEAWDVQGYTGIELWNGMSEFKSLIKTRLHAAYYAFNPQRIASAPPPEALRKWDELLASGQRVAAIAGSDAHALPARLGPLKSVLFSYEFHFRTINMHLMVPSPMSGDVEQDRRMVLEALGRGRGFIGYDLPAPTRGFRFTAQGMDKNVSMGEDVSSQNGVTLQIRLPRSGECHLLKDGKILKSWPKQETCTYITKDAGVYRVEAFIHYQGKRRGWIYSNPIYIR